MTKSGIAALFILLIPGVVAGFSQLPNPQPTQTPVGSVNDPRNPPRNSPEITPEDALENNDDNENFRLLSAIELKKVARRRIKLTDAEKQIYKPAAKTDDLKILKVFSAPSCAEKRLVLDARDERCAAAADLLRISFYSFLRGFYGEKIGDFRVLEDTLIAGNGSYIHGFLVDLGETEIGSIGKDSSEVAALRDYPLARTLDEESAHRKDLENGFSYQNLNIRSQQKLKTNHIYLMRLVSYGLKGDRLSIYNKDSVYMLKVGELNNEQMAIILWKRLSEKSAPRLKDE